MSKRGATVMVSWGYEPHSIHLTARNWQKVKSGKPLNIRGKGYRACDGEFYWDYWSFSGGMEGDLVVEYTGGGTGFIGTLDEADIEVDPEPKPKRTDKRAGRQPMKDNSNNNETRTIPENVNAQNAPLGLREELIQNVLRNHPTLTREEAVEMLEAFGA